MRMPVSSSRRCVPLLQSRWCNDSTNFARIAKEEGQIIALHCKAYVTKQSLLDKKSEDSAQIVWFCAEKGFPLSDKSNNRTEEYMKKIVMSVALLGAALTATAGGYLTNTNQSVAFLRNPAQDAAINLNGVYANPAGVSFLDKGFHVGVNWQAAFQTRDVMSKFGPFAYGADNNGDTKTFKATASAPVIPSVQAAWVKNRWALQFNFALVGGGGKAEFEHGMGSFESQVALLGLVGRIFERQRPGAGFNKYKVDAYMRGKQYYFGTTLGASYRINDHFSVYGGVRGIYATAHYYGHLKDIQINPGNGQNFVSAPAYFTQAAQAMQALAAVNPAMAAQARQLGTLAAATQDVTLNADQSDFGFAPIVGAHFHSDYFDVAAKYEFKTRIGFTNESANSASANNLTSLAAYRDGTHVRSDIPALLTVGAQVRPAKDFRINLGYHHYFDKQAKSGLEGAYRNELLDGATQEYLIGLEHDLNEKCEVSGGVQRTVYPNTDNYMSDLTFTTNSTSFGLGLGYKVTEKVKVNAGYFFTLYDAYRKESANYNNAAAIIGLAQGQERAKQLIESGVVKGSDRFTRTNFVFGLGVEVKL